MIIKKSSKEQEKQSDLKEVNFSQKYEGPNYIYIYRMEEEEKSEGLK